MTSLQSLPWRAPEARGRVVVLGSANVDLTVGVERRPSAGETLLGSSVRRYAGGKGANQAAAAAAAGADTTFLGCVGDDADGEFLLTELRDRHIDVQHVRRSPQPTGTAMIMLTPDGENSIIVSPGANTDVDPDFAQRLQPIWSAADIVVTSLEVPTATVAHVAASGGRTLINAAPMTTLESVTIEAADPLVVNESEARLLLHAAPDEPFDVLATALLERGARSVVVTLGGNGAIVADASGAESIPAYDVPVVDTTGAGDAFVGAVAAELARGNHLRSAVRFGTAMAALSIQRHGAQVSYQRRAAVEAFILRSTKEHGT